VISGREAAVINLGGEKVNPERIEEVLTSFPGIKQAAVFTVVNAKGVDELYAAVVGDSFAEGALRAHCERHLAPEHVPLRFLPTARIHLNQMGKIDRSRLGEATGRA
jgi:acyl-CoA synthetase (AMP-forming)/AMP-acid ligase II